MIQFIIILSFMVIALCVAALARPNIFRKMIDFYSVGSRLYLAGFVRLVLGIFILMLAAQARLWEYVAIIGLLAAASGLSIFFFPLRRTKKLLSRIQHQSKLTLRLYALIVIAIWALLVYALRP